MPTCDPTIYQLKVVLKGISPMIWRRLQVYGDSTIADLHYIDQIAMGWSDDHLHQFRIHGKCYEIARMDSGISFSDDCFFSMDLSTIGSICPGRTFR